MADSGPLSTNEVCDPAVSCAEAVLTSKTSGPPAVARLQASGPPDVMEHAEAQVTPVPVLVPAKTTSHEVAVGHDIGLPPLFLIDMVMATGELDDDAPAFREAPTTVTLELEVALLTRL